MTELEDVAAAAGRFELLCTPAGQVGGMIRNRRPAADIMRKLVDGAVCELTRLRAGIEVRA
jgi:hypothetical protein